MEMEYYDTVNKEWVVELWAVNAGDVLKVPDNSSDEYMKLTSWHATYGVPFGFEKMYKYAGDKLRAIDSGCRKDYYTSGQPTDKPLTTSFSYLSEKPFFQRLTKGQRYEKIVT